MCCISRTDTHLWSWTSAETSIMSSYDSLPNKMSHTHVVYIIVGTVGIFLSTLAVILRFTSRLLTLSIRWDDWACLGALIFAYACIITVILDATIGHSGYDTRLYSMSMLEMLIKVREPQPWKSRGLVLLQWPYEHLNTLSSQKTSSLQFYYIPQWMLNVVNINTL